MHSHDEMRVHLQVQRKARELNRLRSKLVRSSPTVNAATDEVEVEDVAAIAPLRGMFYCQSSTSASVHTQNQRRISSLTM